MKIFIFWAPGSGKTTALQEIWDAFAIPSYELDQYFLDHGAVDPKSVHIRDQFIDDILKKNVDWCIEGMYRQDWMDKIIRASDYIFIMQIPIYILHYRVIRRTLRRIFNIENHPRESSWKLLFWFLYFNQFTYRNHHLPDFKERLLRLSKNAIVISSAPDLISHIHHS